MSEYFGKNPASNRSQHANCRNIIISMLTSKRAQPLIQGAEIVRIICKPPCKQKSPKGLFCFKTCSTGRRSGSVRRLHAHRPAPLTNRRPLPAVPAHAESSAKTALRCRDLDSVAGQRGWLLLRVAPVHVHPGVTLQRRTLRPSTSRMTVLCQAALMWVPYNPTPADLQAMPDACCAGTSH